MTAPPNTSHAPAAQTTSSPISLNSANNGPQKDQITLTRSFASSTRSLAVTKRSISRDSWAKAFTTRMPGIVSASTLVMSPQATLAREKPRRSRSRTAYTSHTTNGKGTSVSRASVGLSHTSTAAVSTRSMTFEANSMRLTDRKMLILSVSLPTRDIRSPVRLLWKKSSESDCMWA